MRFILPLAALLALASSAAHAKSGNPALRAAVAEAVPAGTSTAAVSAFRPSGAASAAVPARRYG